MNKYKNIELGSTVAFYSNKGTSAIYLDKYNVSRSRKMYSLTPSAMGKVVSIKGHNGDACRVTLDNGQAVEVGLSTHYHLENAIGECLHHRDTYALNRD
jgi:hypothetical protein